MTVLGLGGLSLACGFLGDGSGVAQKMHQYADEACACPTLECLQEVQSRQAAYFREHGQDVAAAGEQGRKAVQKSAERIAECATKLAKGEGPSPSSGTRAGARKSGKKKAKGKKKRR